MPLGEIAAVHTTADGTVAVIELDVDGILRVLPLSGLSDGAVPYPAGLVRRGPSVGPDQRLSVGEVAAVFAFYGVGQVDLSSAPLTTRVVGFGDVSSTDPRLRPLPPIVVTKPRLHGD
ncbi:hypothetical protein Val02_22280 [Virgisporangium aliadipatigenens]|uniref:Uncharacterized protein n=1 Tax=Virgisporangium aliadipatigenens TaxID=741659 RepID=A0A8J4DQF8_9ACTN|nr:hypothetical protein Val02_22280 [Virgisporangium aliadipatigenens]